MADIRVPTLGESVTEATVGKWFKQPGDAVAVDEPLVELETDKVTLEVPAPAAGVLSDVAVKNGDTVAVGALLGQIKEGAAAASKAAPAGCSSRRPAQLARRTRRPSKPGRSVQALNNLSRARCPAPLAARRPQCRCRPRCARWRRKAASTHQGSAAPVCTARSPKAT